MQRGLAITWFILVMTLIGCGDDTLSEAARIDLSESVADSARVAKEESREWLEERSVDTGISQPEISPGGPCQSADEHDPTPTGTEAQYICFHDYSYEFQGSRASTEVVITVYEISGDCWRGVETISDGDLFSGAYEESRRSQKEIDSGSLKLHGCIGKPPPDQGHATSFREALEQTEDPRF